MSRRIVTPTALLIAVVVAATGCSSSSPKAHPSTPPKSVETSTAPTQHSSSTQVPPTALQVAKSQALSLVPKYYGVLDELASSSTLSLNGLDLVASGADAIQEKSALAEYRTNGWTQRGATVVARATVSGADLTNEPSKNPQVLPTVRLTTCIDVSKVREIDKSGKTVTLSTRANFFIETLTVVNIAYPSSTGWRVSEAPNKAAKSCSAD